MKNLSLLLLLFLSASCSKQSWEIATNTCTLNETINTSYSKAAQLQSIMDKYTKAGIPGVVIAVYSPEGYWASASGFSKIENQTLMQPCHLQYSQSVSK